MQDDSGVSRDDIFLMTKIRAINTQHLEACIKIFGQIDCLLMHCPTQDTAGDWNWLCKNPRSEIKHLGVSNSF